MGPEKEFVSGQGLKTIDPNQEPVLLLDPNPLSLKKLDIEPKNRNTS